MYTHTHTGRHAPHMTKALSNTFPQIGSSSTIPHYLKHTCVYQKCVYTYANGYLKNTALTLQRRVSTSVHKPFNRHAATRAHCTHLYQYIWTHLQDTKSLHTCTTTHSFLHSCVCLPARADRPTLLKGGNKLSHPLPNLVLIARCEPVWVVEIWAEWLENNKRKALKWYTCWVKILCQ